MIDSCCSSINRLSLCWLYIVVILLTQCVISTDSFMKDFFQNRFGSMIDPYPKTISASNIGIGASNRITSRDTSAIFGNFTLSLCRSLNVQTPSYVQILADKMLSITSFSLLKRGSVTQYDLSQPKDTPLEGRKLNGEYAWPNELATFKDNKGQTVLLVPDGFLLPGQNDGGLYAIINPNAPYSQPIRITAQKKGWFYHRAVYVQLPGGKAGILTGMFVTSIILKHMKIKNLTIDNIYIYMHIARANKPLLGQGKGELVWLSLPDNFDSIVTDGILPETVLVTGPDVMFEVLDLDTSDEFIEVVSAHFFEEKLSVHSIRSIDEYPYIVVSKSCTLDTIGRPYGLCLANMDHTHDTSSSSHSNIDSVISNAHNDNVGYPHIHPTTGSSSSGSSINKKATHILVSTHECSYDIPSAVDMALSAIGGAYPRIKSGKLNGLRNSDMISTDTGLQAKSSERGGSLFAYRLPKSNIQSVSNSTVLEINSSDNGGNSGDNKLLNWHRSILFRGFKVRGWGGIFSPGAPGFPYVFNMPDQSHSPPLILLAGDCTGSAYVFTPVKRMNKSNKSDDSNSKNVDDNAATYELAFEIECGATVGSACYNQVKDTNGDAIELYVPSYELNKVHIFRLSNNKPTWYDNDSIVLKGNNNSDRHADVYIGL